MKKSLKSWQPSEVSKSSDTLTLTVTLNENQITPTVYEAIINAGACMDIWTKDIPMKYLKPSKSCTFSTSIKHRVMCWKTRSIPVRKW
ncbi:hypothetical protein ACQZWC_000088 [Enterobacter bugandensis]